MNKATNRYAVHVNNYPSLPNASKMNWIYKFMDYGNILKSVQLPELYYEVLVLVKWQTVLDDVPFYSWI